MFAKKSNYRKISILLVIALVLAFVDSALAANISVDNFNPGANNWVSALAVQPDGRILVGGYFSQLGGAGRSYIGRLNADGSLDTSFNPGANGIVISLVVQPDGKILVGGAFTTLGGSARSKIGRLNADGTLDTSFNPGANGSIHTFTLQPDGKILVGGEFTTLGGDDRSKIGRLNADGSLDASFNPGANMANISQAVVYALAVQLDGKILVGGEFTELGGSARTRIGRLNMNGSLDADFNTTEYFSTVTGLIVQPDGRILVGGGAITRLNTDGSLDSSFSAGTNNVNSSSMELQLDGKILLGGMGTTHYIKWLNTDGSLDTNFDPGSNSYIESMVIQPDGRLLVGGNFIVLGGSSRNNIGRLSNDTSTVAQTLTSDNDGTTITWQRSGAGPEVACVTFELSTDGVNYSPLGMGERINSGWQLTGLALPKEQSLYIRARGYYGSGSRSGSVVESVNNIHLAPLTFVVTKTEDTNDVLCNSDCSLREAIDVASTGDTISFAPSLTGQTIYLTSSLLIDKDLTIDGSSLDSHIQISGDTGNNGTGDVRVFSVGSGVTVTLNSLIITKGMISGADGGGIYNSGTLTVTNSTLSGNTADRGGGIYNNTGSTLHVTNSSILNNTTHNDGGGIYNFGGILTLTDTTISDNVSANFGGGGVANTGTLNITNNTISHNSTTGYGGGGIVNSGTLTVKNSTIANNASNNVVGDGGGVLNVNTATIINSTFSGNSAIGKGGGIYNSGTINLVNTILANSTSGGDCFNYSGDSITTNINNLIEINGLSGHKCGTPTLTSDPNLGPLADNGGSTQTIALLPNSPAINAGNDGACENTDQRGIERPKGLHCDIGAFEYDYTGIYYVKPLASGTGNCQSWDNACTLQIALTTALNGDEIWAAAGTYKPTTGTDRTATFQLRNGIAIYGGFAGTETARDQHDPATNITTLSGDLNGDDVGFANNAENVYHVVTGATGATLDGFTITAGNANGGSSSNGRGGGMFNSSSNPILTNVTFNGNLANIGGGMYNQSNSNPTLTNVIFSGNSAQTTGGGISNNYSSPTFTNVTFSRNSLTYIGGEGGGMSNYYSNPTLTNVTFSENSPTYLGGGISNYYSNPTLMNVTFSKNSATNSGGGMNNSKSSPTLTNVTFKENSAPLGGGMKNYDNSNPVLTNVTFSGNSASQDGGGVDNYSNCNPILTNVTFSGNSANAGGGMFNYASDPQIRNTIFWNNTAVTIGNQIYNTSAESSPVVSYSIILGGYAGGTNIITSDPLLGTLDSYGGTTQTIPLLPGSSAIDTGNSDYCLIKDQRGLARISTCDIGAFESQGFTLTKSGGDNQSAPANTAFTNPLALNITANKTGEPVNGGKIILTAPNSDASTTTTAFTLIVVNGAISQTVTANSIIGGPYNVVASTAGAANVNFALTNIGTPEVGLKGNDNSIVDGDTTPSNTDHTDFGSVDISSGTVDRVFTIENTGTAALNLTDTPKLNISGANASDFTVTVNPNSPVTASGSTTFTVRFDPSATGTRTATISIANNDGDENPYNFDIQGAGNAVNNPPTISDITDKSTNEDTVNGSIAFTIGDAETPAASLIITATSSNTALVPNGNIILAGSDANRILNITPEPNQSGTTTITVTVADGTDIASDTFLLTVITVNDLPTISDITDKSTNEDTATGIIAFTVGDVETPASSLIITTTSSNTALVPNGNITLGGSDASRTLNIMPASNQSGTATITVTVADGTDTASDTFLLTVNTVNDLPTISDITDKSTNEDTATGSIAFTVGDMETPATSLIITASSSNTTLVPNGNIILAGSDVNRTLNITPASNQNGTTTITVTVDDGIATTSDTFVLTVNALSTNANLSDLVFSTGALSPTFAAGTTTYIQSVTNATTSLNVTPTVEDITATIKVNNVVVATGSPSGSISLVVGDNVITTVVTAQDGTITKTYTVTVTRAAPAIPSVYKLFLPLLLR